MKTNFKYLIAACTLLAMTALVGCDGPANTEVDDPTTTDPDTTVIGGDSAEVYYTLQYAEDAFNYDANGMWESTWDSTKFFYTYDNFYLTHSAPYPSYWEGFVPSVAKVDGGAYAYYSCVAKGGVKGEGTPYTFAYWSAYSPMSNAILFALNGVSTVTYKAIPQEVYICNATQSYKDITEGDYTGYKFSSENNDYFALKIYGILDEEMTLTKDPVVYYLADFRDGKSFINNGWEKVDLKELGEVYGLKFEMESTGVGDYGINTSTYFALDALKVKVVD